MVRTEPPSVSVSHRGDKSVGSDPRRTVVWVRGEHDVATRMYLSVTIAQAARADDADVVVDLSGVTFMDASTIGALVGARNRLRTCLHSLSVRAPSARARHLLDLCGLGQLIDEGAATAQPSVLIALGSWVPVPAADRVPDVAQPAAVRDVPSQEPAPASKRRETELAAAAERGPARS